MQESKPPLIMRRGHFDGFSATVSFSRTTKLMSLKINRVQVIGFDLFFLITISFMILVD